MGTYHGSDLRKTDEVKLYLPPGSAAPRIEYYDSSGNLVQRDISANGVDRVVEFSSGTRKSRYWIRIEVLPRTMAERSAKSAFPTRFRKECLSDIKADNQEAVDVFE